MQALVRVPDLDPSVIQAVLDLGADGVIVPRVDGAADAAAAVAAARYAPEGRRGVNPWVRSADYAGDRNSFAAANRRLAVLVMVESTEALDELEAICAVPGLDGIFLGPADLSASMGLIGQPGHPSVLAAVEEAVATALAAGSAVAAFAADPARAEELSKLGVSLVALDEDSNLIRRSLGALRDTGL